MDRTAGRSKGVLGMIRCQTPRAARQRGFISSPARPVAANGKVLWLNDIPGEYRPLQLVEYRRGQAQHDGG
jgi:hypothetical protein